MHEPSIADRYDSALTLPGEATNNIREEILSGILITRSKGKQCAISHVHVKGIEGTTEGTKIVFYPHDVDAVSDPILAQDSFEDVQAMLAGEPTPAQIEFWKDALKHARDTDHRIMEKQVSEVHRAYQPIIGGLTIPELAAKAESLIARKQKLTAQRDALAPTASLLNAAMSSLLLAQPHGHKTTSLDEEIEALETDIAVYAELANENTAKKAACPSPEYDDAIATLNSMQGDAYIAAEIEHAKTAFKIIAEAQKQMSAARSFEEIIGTSLDAAQKISELPEHWLIATHMTVINAQEFHRFLTLNKPTVNQICAAELRETTAATIAKLEPVDA